MGNIQGATDYSLPCGQLPRSFIEMVAACLVNSGGTTYINMIPSNGSCSGLTDFWTCANNGNMNAETAEAALIANAFGIDACGHIGLKIFADFGILD